MKLYILKAREGLEKGDDPWDPWYDKMFTVVIRAPDETRAREIAQENSLDESRGEFMGKELSKTKTPWLDNKYSSCDELKHEGRAEVIITDVHWA